MKLICGVVRLDGEPAARADLDAMAAALVPSDLAASVALRAEGAAALASVDFTGGEAQSILPFDSEGAWLSGDIRLDRPLVLAERLGLPTASDADALALAAFRVWGKDLPDKLDGDFAYAIWEPGCSRLTCGRDIMGVRPFCYTYRPGEYFAFASLPRALWASGLARPDPDHLALARMMFNFVFRGPATGFSDIAWLEPGHSLSLAPDGIIIHRAWQPKVAQVGRWTGTSEEAAATLRELIEEAVICRLPPTGDVAAHLSGGLDSSAIAVIAARRLRDRGNRLHTWSLLEKRREGCVANEETEEDFIRAVLAQEPDVAWSAVSPTPLDGEGPDNLDLPMCGPAALSDAQVCRAAVAAGATVLLSGAGGDEAASYNGSNIYAELARSGYLATCVSELRARARQDHMPLWRGIYARLILPIAPDWILALARLRSRREAPRHDRRSLLLSFLNSPWREQIAERVVPGGGVGVRNRPRDRIAALTDSYIAGRNTRWALLGAAYGIAFTFPLLDRKVIDFCLSLPLKRFVRGGFTRQPFRDAMVGILPDAVRLRQSKFQAAPDLPRHMAAAKAALHEQAEALRHEPGLDMFNVDAISEALGEIADPGSTDHDPLRASSAKVAHLRSFNALRPLVLAQHLVKLRQAEAASRKRVDDVSRS